MADIYQFGLALQVYSDCNLQTNVIGTLAANTNVQINQINNGWYQVNNSGWVNPTPGCSILPQSTTQAITTGSSVNTSATQDINGIPIQNQAATYTVSSTDGVNALITDGTNSYTVPFSSLSLATNPSLDVSQQAMNQAQQSSTLTAVAVPNSNLTSNTNITSTAGNTLTTLRVSTLQGIFGMPYQFMPIVDRRLDPTNQTDSFGRTYADKIVARLPLLIMVPGLPQFLAGYSQQEKQSIVSYALSLASGSNTTDLNNLVNNPGRYYGLSVDWTDYYNYVNPMCTTAARVLNLQDQLYLGQSLGSFLWQNAANQSVSSVLNYKGGVAFYINQENQITESFNNATAESQLANKINGISDMGREMNFLLGGAGALTGIQFDQYTNQNSVAKSNEENKQDMSSKMLSGPSFIQSITGSLKTVIAGGKLIFPEIWSDSQFSRDYNVSIKLVSPDCDKLSIYLNIIVPLLHLVGFVAPRAAGPNGFISPFLVRAFYKGMFNCDMGIITNMSINKGGEGQWTPDGLPTVVDVSFTIKELYSAMSMSTNQNISTGILSNITLMDYIGNLCGININEPDIMRTLYFYYSQYVANKFENIVYTDIAGGLDQWATNKVLSLFRSN